ncbi:MAG: helix-turn-helix transcriptional regulator [Clostridiales bacterium]|nr:helix-turn-helix transcriptional regulator [Clostridiales bacterium]
MDQVRTTEEFGRTIRARRKELGYTQAFLADYAGVSASFLSELENGKETIQLGKAMTIMSLLGMNMAVMKRGE